VRRADGAEAGQRFLARLIAVVAVVVGLLVLIAPLGIAGMPGMSDAAASSSGESMTASGSSTSHLPMIGHSCNDGAASTGISGCAFSAPVPMTFSLGSSLPEPQGAVLACVVFLLAVLAGLWVLRLPCSSPVALLDRPAVLALLVRPMGRPVLAELCVLRI
jgi:hypothetical protein